MTKAGDHLKTVISEEVDAEGKIVKTTQVWDAANRKLLSSHKEIIDDQEKLAKEQQKLQESLVQTSKTVNILKNSAGQIITTTEEIAKNGDRVYTVITETENGLGRLTKETEKYVLTKNQQGEVEKKILENSKESINNQLQEIEKLEQLNQYKKELTTTTRESEEAVRREGQVYRAVVKTIQEETHEYGTLTTTITTYKDALGNTVVETRKVNEAGEEVAQTTRTVTNELNKAADGNQKLGSSANQAAKETKAQEQNKVIITAAPERRKTIRNRSIDIRQL